MVISTEHPVDKKEDVCSIEKTVRLQREWMCRSSSMTPLIRTQCRMQYAKVWADILSLPLMSHWCWWAGNYCLPGNTNDRHRYENSLLSLSLLNIMNDKSTGIECSVSRRRGNEASRVKTDREWGLISTPFSSHINSLSFFSPFRSWCSAPLFPSSFSRSPETMYPGERERGMQKQWANEKSAHSKRVHQLPSRASNEFRSLSTEEKISVPHTVRGHEWLLSHIRMLTYRHMTVHESTDERRISTPQSMYDITPCLSGESLSDSVNQILRLSVHAVGWSQVSATRVLHQSAVFRQQLGDRITHQQFLSIATLYEFWEKQQGNGRKKGERKRETNKRVSKKWKAIGELRVDWIL